MISILFWCFLNFTRKTPSVCLAHQVSEYVSLFKHKVVHSLGQMGNKYFPSGEVQKQSALKGLATAHWSLQSILVWQSTCNEPQNFGENIFKLIFINSIISFISKKYYK